MDRTSGSWLLRGALLWAVAITSGMADSGPTNIGEHIYAGYYSREQNDGEMARASRNSHYIRFYPGNRVVRLIIPFPYSTTVSADTIRKVFDMAVSRSVGGAYISDTFGLLDERIVAHLDSVRLIDGEYYYDCGVAVPCRIEFMDEGMNIVQQGLVRDHVTAYHFVPD